MTIKILGKKSSQLFRASNSPYKNRFISFVNRQNPLTHPLTNCLWGSIALEIALQDWNEEWGIPAVNITAETPLRIKLGI